MNDWLPDPLGPRGSDEFLAAAREGARQAALKDACDLLDAHGLTGCSHLIRQHLQGYTGPPAYDVPALWADGLGYSRKRPPRGSRGALEPDR